MPSLNEVADTFAMLPPAERLEWLIEFGTTLPILADAWHNDRNAGNFIVHECQAPVFLKALATDDVVSIHADVPKEAPIARGFVSFLIAVFFV